MKFLLGKHLLARSIDYSAMSTDANNYYNIMKKLVHAYNHCSESLTPEPVYCGSML